MPAAVQLADGPPFKGRPFNVGFDVPFYEAIAATRNRGVVLPEVFYGDLQRWTRENAFTMSQIESVETIRAVLDHLTDAMAKGSTFEDWQRTVADDLANLTPARQELIFRNAMQTGYSIGHTLRQAEQADTRPFLMWDAINDDRTRPTHRAMDGYIAPIDDHIWTIWDPPAGHNCRCSRISLTAREAYARGYPMTPPNVQPDPGFGYQKTQFWGLNLSQVLHDRSALAPSPVREAVATQLTLQDHRNKGIEYVIKQGTDPWAARNEIEFCYGYSPDGKVLMQRMGESQQITFRPSESQAYLQNPGSFYIHNHPSSGGALSVADLRTAADLNMNSIMSVGHDGSTWEAFNINKAPDPELIAGTYDSMAFTLKLATTGPFADGLLGTPMEASNAFYQIVNAATARARGYGWRAMPTAAKTASIDRMISVLAGRWHVANTLDAIVDELIRRVNE